MMSQHKNHHSKHDKKHAHHGPKKGKGFHKDWKTWTVIILMLASMLVYVLSFDEADPQNFGGPVGTQGEMPAAAE